MKLSKLTISNSNGGLGGLCSLIARTARRAIEHEQSLRSRGRGKFFRVEVVSVQRMNERVMLGVGRSDQKGFSTCILKGRLVSRVFLLPEKEPSECL